VVHLYHFKDLNIVLDTGSGAVHAVSDAVYDILSCCSVSFFSNEQLAEVLSDLSGKYPLDTLREAMSEIGDLAAAKMLFVQDPGKEEVSEITEVSIEGQNAIIKAMCLHIAHDCNMRCDYCFADTGGFSGERSLMPLETGKKAIDFLMIQSRDQKYLDVDFFGGEPLLNWEVVKEIVTYARQKGREYDKKFRFTLTTNGLLIDDDVINFTNREMHNVVLSLDGRQETHDSKRKLPDGSGSYDEVLPKIKKLVEARRAKGYYIRGTYTNSNPDFILDIFHLADLGFKELAIEPAVSKTGTSYALHYNDLPGLLDQYESLALEMIKRRDQGRGFNFYHYMIDLLEGPCLHKRIKGCGVGTEYMAVAPNGELYPCHQFIGDRKFLLGDVCKGVVNKNTYDQFSRLNIYSKKECQTCWARFYCSGGCAANAYYASGSIYGVNKLECELIKKRIECAIMIKVSECI